MGMYLVTLPKTVVKTLKNGVDMMVVSATDATDAKAAAAAKYTGDSVWSDATATLLADTAVTATGALTGWRFKITIGTPTPKVFLLTAAGASQDTLDEIGTALATLINLDADIAGAAYNTTPQALKVAETTDALGDMAVTAEVFPPIESDSGGQTNSDVPIPGFIASITDEGAKGDALVVTFAADTLIVPTVKFAGKQ
jgi:hypothetical protein